MLISTPEELRAFLPSHVYRNIDPVRGFLTTSENTFLRQRIGQPLLAELQAKYAELGPIIQTPTSDAFAVSSLDTDPADVAPWAKLIYLCQGCIVFDAFARAADVQTVSVNDSGLNVAESEGYDAANDKRIDRYKAQLIKESHAAVDQLLIQLEEWEAQVSIEPSIPTPPLPIIHHHHHHHKPAQSPVEGGASAAPDTESPVEGGVSAAPDAEAEFGEGSSSAAPDTEAEFGEGTTDTPAPEPTPSPISAIIALWHQSPTHQLVDGLLFNTATEFQRYVDIYESRDRFITLLPDIRFCQELHLESELSPELLHYIVTEHRNGRYEGSEQKIAWMMLQRSLSLYVEARAKMFTRTEARDEATGYMKLTLNYIRRNQRQLAPKEFFINTPLFEPHHWPWLEADFGEGSEGPVEGGASAAHTPEAEFGEGHHHHHVHPNLHGHPVPTHPHCVDNNDHAPMLISSMI